MTSRNTDIFREIRAEEYADADFSSAEVFDSPDFIRLNAPKADRVAYYAGYGLRLALGRGTDGIWRAPFSAPYSIPTVTNRAEYDFEAFAKELIKSLGRVKFVLPPPFHSHAAEWREALGKAGLVEVIDYNYHYPLEQAGDFDRYLHTNTKRNLKSASRHRYVFEPKARLDEVYDFVAAHHQLLGYPMAMTRQQVLDTASVIDIDAMTLSLDGAIVAAGYFYHVAPGIVQMICWADDRTQLQLKPMPYFAKQVVQHYATNRKLKILDLGPASSEGVKNEGLVRFKLGLGAIESEKPTFISGIDSTKV